jgi:transposase
MLMPVQSKELDFRNQSIYIGLDVHLKSWKVTILTEHNKHKTFSMDPNPESLSRYLHTHFPGGTYYSAYEAGFCGVWIHRRLLALDINNIVVNPGDVPTMDKERKEKRDSVDSNKIARSLRGKELTGIYIHDEEILHDRTLLRYRSAIVKKVNSTKHQIKSDLYLNGVEYPNEMKDPGRHWSGKFIQWLKTEVVQMGGVNGPVLELRIKEYEEQRNNILTLTRMIRALSRSDRYAELMHYLCSVPGIGLITGMSLLVSIGEISRFADKDHFAGYIGLKPTCHSSGEKDNRGEITPRCQALLRNMIIESAWVAARIDPALSMSYNKLCHRMDANKAIVRIARKLANRIYYVLTNRCGYIAGVVI